MFVRRRWRLPRDGPFCEPLHGLLPIVFRIPGAAIAPGGCCPWDHCPNMKPAFKVLHELGYTKVRVVEIPQSFKIDWMDKGFAVEGSAVK